MAKDSPEEKKGNRKWVLLFPLLLIIGVAGGVGGTVLGGYLNHKYFTENTQTKIVPKISKDEVMIPLDEFLVNLAKNEAGTVNYIKIQLTLTASDSKKAELINTSLDFIRDSVINTLRKKTSDAILNEDKGVDHLKEELKNNLNKEYGSDLVQDIYITNLVIQ